MKKSPQDRLPQPRGEEEREYARMLPQLEQIVRHAMHRTQHWKTPPGYETAYWDEERESIAWVAVWEACLSYRHDANVSFPVHAFFKAVQAIRQEHRLAWRWSISMAPIPQDAITGEPVELIDPEWRTPFEQCENDSDLQLLLLSLPESERELMCWWCRDGLTEREIAQRLNLSKTAVHKRLARIKRKLQEVLADQSMSW